ncbi:MAG: hypothetical protein LBD48_07870 [Treponema sp.]|jgi:Zn ribbon nucleic-acid-binding protein|nr:hypothetical protein [Treponema sp.]
MKTTSSTATAKLLPLFLAGALATAVVLGGCPQPAGGSTTPPAEHAHNFGGAWQSDASGHWKVCQIDGTTKGQQGAHTESGWILDKAASTTEEGGEHKECTVCGYVLAQNTIPVIDHTHTHDFGGAWQSDASGHWKVCQIDGTTIGQQDTHTESDWIVTKEPSATEEGDRHKECTVCGYVLAVETIDTIDIETMAPAVNNVLVFLIGNESQFLISTLLYNSVDGGIIGDLKGQNAAIRDQYVGIDTPFASTVRELLNNIELDYTNTAGGVDIINSDVGAKINAIINAVYNLFGADTASKNLFEARLNAFRAAHYIGQRTGNYGINATDANLTNKINQLTVLRNQIQTLGGGTLSDDITEVITMLTTQIKSTMPQGAGVPRYNLLQQIEDFEQVIAWGDDVKFMGFIPNSSIIADASMAPSKLHTNTIMANDGYLAAMGDKAPMASVQEFMVENPSAETIAAAKERAAAGIYLVTQGCQSPF